MRRARRTIPDTWSRSIRRSALRRRRERTPARGESAFHLGSRDERHSHSVLRSQRDQWIELHLVSGHEPEAPPLPERREQQHTLHPCELLTDALARAAAEREVREARTLGRRLVQPALGPEELGLRKEARVPLSDVRTNDDERALRYVISAKGLGC